VLPSGSRAISASEHELSVNTMLLAQQARVTDHDADAAVQLKPWNDESDSHYRRGA
jgi:hypothetical protein